MHRQQFKTLRAGQEQSMKTSRYIFLKTVWVVLRPLLPIYVVLPFWSVYVLFSHKYISIGSFVVAPVAFVVLSIISFTMWRVLRWIRKTIQYEDLPENFLMCLIPWFIPLLYTLLVTFAACFTACLGWEHAPFFLFCSQLMYFFVWNYVDEYSPWIIITASFLPFIVSFVTAIVGYYKVLDDRPPSKHWHWYFCTPVLLLSIGIIVAHVRLCFFNSF